MHTCTHKHTHTYVHTYIHTYIHTYRTWQFLLFPGSRREPGGDRWRQRDRGPWSAREADPGPVLQHQADYSGWPADRRADSSREGGAGPGVVPVPLGEIQGQPDPTTIPIVVVVVVVGGSGSSSLIKMINKKSHKKDKWQAMEMT